ncbi:MAG: hypothetical protein ACYYK0_00985 [Candidatus Eutrophobiaceae bacterium]
MSTGMAEGVGKPMADGSREPPLPLRKASRPIGILLCMWLLANVSWRTMEPFLDSPVGAQAGMRTEQQQLGFLHFRAPERIRAHWVPEPLMAARLIFLGLHNMDSYRGHSVPLADMDIGKVLSWIDLASRLDPHSEYPLLLAALVYMHVPKEAEQRRIIALVENLYRQKPAQRQQWRQWMAWYAHHRLGDPELAHRYDKESPAAPRAAPQNFLEQP